MSVVCGTPAPSFFHETPVRAFSRNAARMSREGKRGENDLPAGSRVRSNPDTERILSGGRREPVVLEVRSGGSRIDDLLVEILRKAIRAQGGDVQLVLGRN
jgi:hypothetical protein